MSIKERFMRISYFHGIKIHSQYSSAQFIFPLHDFLSSWRCSRIQFMDEVWAPDGQLLIIDGKVNWKVLAMVWWSDCPWPPDVSVLFGNC